MENIFFELGLIIIIAAAFAYIARLLKQPLIPAYILTGIVLGPLMGLITNTTVISTMSEIGIAFLLFIVGLEMDIRKLKDVGLVSSLGGLIQILSTFTLAFFFAILIGFKQLHAVYIGLIIALSSTMVVVKLLSDKRELDTLHGRIIIGILLMQDIVAILALSLLTSLNQFSVLVFVFALIKGLAVFLVAVACSRFIFPYLFKFAAKSQELLFLMAIAVLFAFSIFFNQIGKILIFIWDGMLQQPLSYNLQQILQPGFSIAIGAFVAGVTLANLPYNIEIIGKAKSLRDFFSTIFFVSLGMVLLLSSIRTIILPLILFLLFIVLLKPYIIMFLSSFFGYKKKISFLTGISMAQVSEFSLIMVSQGLVLGHVNQEMFSLTILLAVITITLTPYFVKYEDKLYSKAKPMVAFLDNLTEGEEKLEYEPGKIMGKYILLCGHNRIGYSVVKIARKLKRDVLVIDFNPEVIRHLIREHVPCIYGDVGDSEVLERVNLKKAEMVISTVPAKHDNFLLIKKTREENPKALVIVTASQVDEALSFYNAGADYVILPHFLGGEHLAALIEDFTEDLKQIIKRKETHIIELNERKKIGHEHPSHN